MGLIEGVGGECVAAMDRGPRRRTHMATLVKRSAGWKKAKMRRESVESAAWSSRPLEAANSPREQLLTRRRTALTAVGEGGGRVCVVGQRPACQGVHLSMYVCMDIDRRSSDATYMS